MSQKKYRRNRKLRQLEEKLLDYGETQSERIIHSGSQEKGTLAKVVIVRLTYSKFRLLQECVATCIPKLIHELDSQGWYCCPNCHNVVERE